MAAKSSMWLRLIAFPLLLLRGTELDHDRAHWGLQVDRGDMPMVVVSNSFDRADWNAMARIAEALRLTEGRHPADLRGLLRVADDLVPVLERWRPDEAA